MILRAEIASNPLIEGRDRGFLVRVDGNKLTFKTNLPAGSPQGDVIIRRSAYRKRRRIIVIHGSSRATIRRCSGSTDGRITSRCRPSVRAWYAPGAG
jgi:hypothetical protein